jgi:23S rRNA A1618 N6-methylase RlmF
VKVIQLFTSRKIFETGPLVAVGSGKVVVSVSEFLEAMKRIKLLVAALGYNTLINKILRKSEDFAKSKMWIARLPALQKDDLHVRSALT